MKKKASMARSNLASQTLCPIARAESVFGDIWSVLVLRELFSENHRFDEIQTFSGATPQMVAARLKSLEADGLVERRLYNKRPPRYEYHLTDKGKDFWPILMAMRAWGEKHCRLPGEEMSVDFHHNVCGHPAGLGPLCDHCGELLRREDLTPRRSDASIAEREAWSAAVKDSRARG